jgi:hypothetical protein
VSSWLFPFLPQTALISTAFSRQHKVCTWENTYPSVSTLLVRNLGWILSSPREEPVARQASRARKIDGGTPVKAEQDARAQQYRARFTVITSKGHSRREPEPIDRWLMLADKVLLDAARAEQRRIKEKIKPHVERYQRITGNKE